MVDMKGRPAFLVACSHEGACNTALIDWKWVRSRRRGVFIRPEDGLEAHLIITQDHLRASEVKGFCGLPRDALFFLGYGGCVPPHLLAMGATVTDDPRFGLPGATSVLPGGK